MRTDTKKMLELAHDNLRIAKKSFEVKLYRSSCFWAHQSIELFLKSFLV